MRSVGCAVEYGQKGVIADGDGVSLRLFALNFNHVGSGGDFSNDPNLAIQANEVTELNNGDVSFVSIDQRGDFRVGDAFFVDQESGTVSFSQQVTSLQALSSSRSLMAQTAALLLPPAAHSVTSRSLVIISNPPLVISTSIRLVQVISTSLVMSMSWVS